jgi:hypothetical protein
MRVALPVSRMRRAIARAAATGLAILRHERASGLSCKPREGRAARGKERQMFMTFADLITVAQSMSFSRHGGIAMKRALVLGVLMISMVLFGVASADAETECSGSR